MVKFALNIGCDLENLSSLQPQGGCNDPDFTYYLKLKCSSCGEVALKECCLCLNQTVPYPSGRGYCHLVRKCKFCSMEARVTMIAGHGYPLRQAGRKYRSVSRLMVFDCRNAKPVGFSFGTGWWAESAAGTKFSDIDLSGGDYADYDEKGECPIMISNLRAGFSAYY